MQETKETAKILNSIDQSILKPTTTLAKIIEEAKKAKEKQFRAFVFHPCYIKDVMKELEGSTIKTAVVCDFPHGREITKSRVNEIKEVISLGVDEIDIVSKYYLLKDNNIIEYKHDIEELAKASLGKKLKIILEVDYLSEKEIEDATEVISNIATENEYNHLTVKTKTGFADNSMENLKASKIIINKLKELKTFGQVTVKASGGIKTKEDALKLIKLGVHYLGTSSGLDIVN